MSWVLVRICEWCICIRVWWPISLALITSFNKTDTSVFACRLPEGFHFPSLILISVLQWKTYRNDAVDIRFQIHVQEFSLALCCNVFYHNFLCWNDQVNKADHKLFSLEWFPKWLTQKNRLHESIDYDILKLIKHICWCVTILNIR